MKQGERLLKNHLTQTSNDNHQSPFAPFLHWLAEPRDRLDPDPSPGLEAVEKRAAAYRSIAEEVQWNKRSKLTGGDGWVPPKD